MSSKETDIDTIKPPTAAQKRQVFYYWPLALALGWIALDQWTKWLVEVNLAPAGTGQGYDWLGGQVRIVYIINKGASFGFLNNADVAWFFTALALAATIGVVWWYSWHGTTNRWLQLATGLILGGIVGNLIDRLFKGGGVTDMITLPNVAFFKVFNVADSGITVGTAIVLITILVGGWLSSRQTKPVATKNEL